VLGKWAAGLVDLAFVFCEEKGKKQNLSWFQNFLKEDPWHKNNNTSKRIRFRLMVFFVV